MWKFFGASSASVFHWETGELEAGLICGQTYDKFPGIRFGNLFRDYLKLTLNKWVTDILCNRTNKIISSFFQPPKGKKGKKGKKLPGKWSLFF